MRENVMQSAFSSSTPVRAGIGRLLSAILLVFGIVALGGALAGCASRTPPPPPVVVAPPPPVASNAITEDKPGYFRLSNMPMGRTPVRVGIILPFNSATSSTRALAHAMMKGAQLALFDANNPDILLMTADEGTTSADAAGAATRLLNQGAEIIIGPLYGSAVNAVAPIARDRGVPVLAFSTDRGVGGNGVYLLSFQPENEVKRVVNYAAGTGKKTFAALIPSTPYGEVVNRAFRDAVAANGGQVIGSQTFVPSADAVAIPAANAARLSADALFIPQGGTVLKAMGPELSANGFSAARTKLIGTSLWDDASIEKEPFLDGAWFAAADPSADAAFNAKYKTVFGSTPPQLAALSYDAVSLVALLSRGTPYKRFTRDALTDPNGFVGVGGIFRLNIDGTLDRGLSVMTIAPSGRRTISPAPNTFLNQGS